MAKPGISKKAKAPSKHSRAARRETDVDIDTDKSLKNVKAPAESVDARPSVLQAQHGAGITKRSKAGRKAVLSTKARRRHRSRSGSPRRRRDSRDDRDRRKRSPSQDRNRHHESDKRRRVDSR
ncbi:hypothetical protein BN1723_008849 [Verticillium longisporum]|uniref:Uncharacterized protein n=1 Tax=Verticillium longisporum TaxID=100787 RepID=A0A0G4KKA6_VERLO|nr:hypothetical protein BN1723_008849 [Verticillium longisporum]